MICMCTYTVIYFAFRHLINLTFSVLRNFFNYFFPLTVAVSMIVFSLPSISSSSSSSLKSAAAFSRNLKVSSREAESVNSGFLNNNNNHHHESKEIIAKSLLQLPVYSILWCPTTRETKISLQVKIDYYR